MDFSVLITGLGFRDILGIYRDNGKENGNYYNGLYIGIMEKNMSKTHRIRGKSRATPLQGSLLNTISKFHYAAVSSYVSQKGILPGLGVWDPGLRSSPDPQTLNPTTVPPKKLVLGFSVEV